MSSIPLQKALANLTTGLPDWLKGGGRKVPVVRQMADTECGAACIAMILAYHGRRIPIHTVADVLGVSRDGVSAKSILEAGSWFGLRGRGVSVPFERMERLPRGAILHWNFRHFVIFERIKGEFLHIIDPALGRRLIPLEQARVEFTGVALLFEPTEKFAPSQAVGGGGISGYFQRAIAHSQQLPVVLVLSLVLQILALGLPLMTGVLVDRVVPYGDGQMLMVVAVGALALVLCHFFSSFIRTNLLLQLRTTLEARMTLGFLDRLMELPYAFFQRRSTGDLLGRVQSHATIREIFTSGALSSVIDGALLCVYIGVLLWASLDLGVLVLVLGLAQIAIFVVSRKKLRELMAKGLQAQAKSDSGLLEVLSGIEVLKAMGNEQKSLNQWSDSFREVLNVTLLRGRLRAIVDSVTSALRIASPMCVLGVGAAQVMEGELTLGGLMSVNALAAGFFGPLAGLLSTVTQFQMLGSYLERVDDVMRTEPEQESTSRATAPRLQGRIVVDNLSFAFSQRQEMVLKEVSAIIEAGQCAAIVGSSGSGKSTLASLIVGLYRPSKGRILVDGLDLEKLELRSYRRQVGIVTQRPHLFGTDIRKNIAMGDADMSLDKIQWAAKMACIAEDIEAMPLRYDTPISEGGASLSGGQRQRLSLARALALDPAVIVLDEATSALDALTEAAVQNSLATLKCTRIVVAHRLSTIVGADIIFVMHKGRLVESGTHAELLAKGGHYAALVKAQLGSDRGN